MVFERQETLGSVDCGRTRLERERWTVMKPWFGATSGDEHEHVTLYRCIREAGHEGEHFGVEVKPPEPTFLWADDGELHPTDATHAAPEPTE